ncbi:hypothetical protein MPH_03353 [Macrophomina phaseolina MS6]|uniref:Uncharacterized protein n=2 Tax=Macrophomina phaseolina TaxID=35725 RepID=K2SAR8_MACPH|nr:hypothetical protein MPH_03353 [Macrophomina phaseolina MS6]KAH7054659.1 hypothetical protein B0J12DRAFT_698254 [Macrophomina phaseolina]
MNDITVKNFPPHHRHSTIPLYANSERLAPSLKWCLLRFLVRSSTTTELTEATPISDSGYLTSSTGERGGSTSGPALMSPRRSPDSDSTTTKQRESRSPSGNTAVDTDEGCEAMMMHQDDAVTGIVPPSEEDFFVEEKEPLRPAMTRSRTMSFVALTQEEVSAIREQEHEDAYYARITDVSLTGFGAELLRSAGATIRDAVRHAIEKAKNSGAKVPSPEECGCPCWNYPDNGWRSCPFLEHKLTEASKRGIVLG